MMNRFFDLYEPVHSSVIDPLFGSQVLKTMNHIFANDGFSTVEEVPIWDLNLTLSLTLTLTLMGGRHLGEFI